MSGTVFGLDVGTTTLSAVAVDALDGSLLCALNEPNDAALLTGEDYARCQDPERIAAIARGMLAALSGRFGKPRAVGLDGQMHGILYVDREGKAVSPLYTWQDGRGDLPDESGERRAARLTRLTGYPCATGFGAVTHDWHAHNRRVPQGAARFCTIQDYLGMRLTGRTAPLTHTSDAASMGLFDMDAGRFDLKALDLAGLDARYFPEVTRDAEALGETPSGAAVSVALGDNQASFLGAVAQPEEAVLVNMGTGGQVSMMSGARGRLTDCERRPLTGERFILAGSSLCGGRAYQLLEGFFRSCAEMAGARPDSLYPAMNRLAQAHWGDQDALTVSTLFCGTRRQPDLRGVIAGLSDTNFDAGHLAAGLVRGMAAENLGYYREMLAAGAGAARVLVGSGNAIRKNPALRRAFEEAFGMAMRVPLHQEEAAYGAALFAMACAGLKKDVFAAQRLIRYGASE